MQVKRRYSDKYARSSPERICCPNYVRLVSFGLFASLPSVFAASASASALQSASILLGYDQSPQVCCGVGSSLRFLLKFHVFNMAAVPVHRKKQIQSALWSRIIKNPDISTGPLALPFACLLVHSHRSLTHSQAHGKDNDYIAIFAVFFSVLNHSGVPFSQSSSA